MTLRLYYTPKAERELYQILVYLQSKSPKGSQRVSARLRQVIETLLEHPESGRQSSHPKLRLFYARPYPYLVFYQVLDRGIVIHRIRHAARNAEESLVSEPW